MKKSAISNHLDILSSIWILVCNDDNPQITYEGILYRLGLPDDFDIRGLVKSRGELFRNRGQESQLSSWKAEMISRKKRLPSFIRDLKDEEEKNNKITSLTINDIFRSQFRSESNAPRSEIQIIEWGLQHIDRLRKAELDTKQERLKYITSVWLPILSTLVAVIAVVSSFYVQYTSNKNQTSLKQYEIEFKPKEEGYSSFMKSTVQSYFSAQQNNFEQMKENLDKVESSFYNIEPFLSQYDSKRIWAQFQQYSGLCYTVLNSDSLRKDLTKSTDSYLWYKNFFRENLYQALFPKKVDILEKFELKDTIQ